MTEENRGRIFVAMGDRDGYPNAGGGDLQIGPMENLPGLIHHLHLFFAIAIIEENIDLRDAGLGDVVGIKLRGFAFFASLPIIEPFLAAATDGLIGRIDDPLQDEFVIQRLEWQHRLDS